MWIRPSTPNARALQPMICRPGGPLRSGWRRVRQAIADQQRPARPSRARRPSRRRRCARRRPRCRAAPTRRRQRRRRRARRSRVRPRPGGAPGRGRGRSSRCCGRRRRAGARSPSQVARRAAPMPEHQPGQQTGAALRADLDVVLDLLLGRDFDRAELDLVRPDVRERELVERDFEPDVLRDRGGEVRVATSAGYGIAPRVTRVTRRTRTPECVTSSDPSMWSRPRRGDPRGRRDARLEPGGLEPG